MTEPTEDYLNLPDSGREPRPVRLQRAIDTFTRQLLYLQVKHTQMVFDGKSARTRSRVKREINGLTRVIDRLQDELNHYKDVA